jgi:tRNA (guanine26-N2/guanine27-N2)-dimethyltransferase
MQKIKYIQITEGKAKLLVPETSSVDPFHLPVFYNPAMKFNRSVSSIVAGVGIGLLEDSVIVDGLCALGARGIRYAKENKIKKIFFVDANPDAIKVLKKNVRLNKIKNATIVKDDFNRFLCNSMELFDFIEMDPFGSPVPFLQNAIRKLKKKAILSITATDLAKLAGAYATPCIREYDAKPMRCEYAHEVAIRLLIGKVARELMQQDFACTPLISFYKGHAIKAVILCEKSAPKADETIGKLGYIMHCNSCLFRIAGKKTIDSCPECGKHMDYAGKLWMGQLQDRQFLEKVEKENEIRGVEEEGEISKMIGMLEKEDEFAPSFYDIHTIAKKHKLQVKGLDWIIAKLEKNGFAATKVHYSPTSIKTDAPIREIVEILKK